MEEASTSETSVNFYQITRRYSVEDSQLQDWKCSLQNEDNIATQSVSLNGDIESKYISGRMQMQ
jgi:hypothetical protein